MYRVHDLGLGHGFAAADYAAVERVALVRLGALVRVHLAEGLGVFAYINCVGAFGSIRARFLNKSAHILGYGRRAGQAGRAYARGVYEARVFVAGADYEVARGGLRAHARERGDYLTQVERGHRFKRELLQFSQSFGCCLGVVLFHLVLRGRAGEYVAVHSGRNQHALAQLAGGLEYDRAHAQRLLVQQHVLALTGADGEAVVAYQARNLVGVYARRVDDVFGADRSAVLKLDGELIVRIIDCNRALAQKYISAVCARVLAHRDCQLIRTGNARRGRPQRRGHVVRQLGFHLSRTLARDYLKPRHTVGSAALQQVVKLLFVLLAKRDNERTHAQKRHVQTFAHIVEHLVAAHVELCHKRARHTVVSRVDYGAVGTACAHRHVVARVAQRDF